MDTEQIAHVLSQRNTRHGHTPYPYSYAQRAVLCSYLTSKKNAFEALHSCDEMANDEPLLWTPAVLDAAIRAEKFEASLLLGRGDVAIAKLSLGQLTKLGDVIRLVRKMSSTRARDAYLERHYELVEGRNSQEENERDVE